MKRIREAQLEKVPGTAELIDFVYAVVSRRGDRDGATWRDRFASCIHALAKTEHDQKIVESIVQAEAELQASQ
jgi:hypothetical protein